MSGLATNLKIRVTFNGSYHKNCIFPLLSVVRVKAVVNFSPTEMLDGKNLYCSNDTFKLLCHSLGLGIDALERNLTVATPRELTVSRNCKFFGISLNMIAKTVNFRHLDGAMMRAALVQARLALHLNEVPVGAVLMTEGRIISACHNMVEKDKDATAHAEMLCLQQASHKLGRWRLHDCTLFVTLEPCAMCAAALLQARVERVVYGAKNMLLGGDGSWVNVLTPQNDIDSISTCQCQMCELSKERRHPFHNIQVERGVCAEECAELMKRFFRKRRLQERSVRAAKTCWKTLLLGH